MAKDVKFNIDLVIDGQKHIVQASADVKYLAQQLGIADRQSRNLTRSMINTNQIITGWQNIASSIKQITAAFNDITAESREFSSAMKAVNTMAGKDSAGFEKLKDQVSELAKTVPMARDQLANGLYQVISNGVPEDNWISYLKSSARSAIGGIADVGEVVKVTSTIIKNYGLEWSAASCYIYKTNNVYGVGGGV